MFTVVFAILACFLYHVDATKKSSNKKSAPSSSTKTATGFSVHEIDSLDIDFGGIYETLQHGSTLPPEYLDALLQSIQDRHFADAESGAKTTNTWVLPKLDAEVGTKKTNSAASSENADGTPRVLKTWSGSLGLDETDQLLRSLGGIDLVDTLRAAGHFDKVTEEDRQRSSDRKAREKRDGYWPADERLPFGKPYIMDAHGNFVEAKNDVMDAVSARENLFDSLEGLSTRKGRSWLAKGPSRKKSTLTSGSGDGATDQWDRARVKDHLRQFLTGESFDSHSLLQVLQQEFGKAGDDYYSLGARGRSGIVLKPFVGEDGHPAAEIELLTPSESVFLLRKIAQFIDTSATSNSSSAENTKSMLEIREMRKKLKKGEKLTDNLQGLSAELEKKVKI